MTERESTPRARTSTDPTRASKKSHQTQSDSGNKLLEKGLGSQTMAAPGGEAPVDPEDVILAQMGYKQELRRGFNSIMVRLGGVCAGLGESQPAAPLR